jgi:phenylacetate-CoA ligase
MGIITRCKQLGLADRLVRRNPLIYPPLRRLLDGFDGEAPRAQREWRRLHLRSVLQAAGRTGYGRSQQSPQYLGDWPILEKDAIRERPGSFLTPWHRLGVGARTSGTTGTPLALKRSLRSLVYEQAVLDWLLENAGVPAHRCRAAVLRGDDIKDPAERAAPFWRHANDGRRLIFSSNHLDADTLAAFLDALREYSPDVLLIYPTVLASLCRLMFECGATLSIPLTVCSSEVLSRATTEIAALTLGTRVLDYYGQAERVAFAYGDPVRGYRFLPSYSVNELRWVESEGDAEIYQLIGTGLWNEVMPLVRYRTGDLVRLARGSNPAAVAAGQQPFLSIIGRSGDYLVAPTGAHLMGIDHIPRGVPRIARAQFVQETLDRVTLLVIPAPGFDEHCRNQLLRQARSKLPPSMRVHIETTAELVRNRSGKAPLVIRKPPVEREARAVPAVHGATRHNLNHFPGEPR